MAEMVNELGWDYRGSPVLMASLRHKLPTIPAGTALTSRAQERRDEFLAAKALYRSQIFTRPYLEWEDPDLRELSAGGLILSPDRTVSVKFTPDRWGSDAGPLNVILIEVELLTAPQRAGMPPYIEFALSNCPCQDSRVYMDYQSDRAFTWQEKNPQARGHIETIARRMFTLFEKFGYDFDVAGRPEWDGNGYFVATDPRFRADIGGRYVNF